MKKFLFLFLLIIAYKNTFGQQKDIDLLTKLNQDWLNSYLTKDTVTLSKIFADDFILINPKGTKMTKSDILSNVVKQETISVKIDSNEVRMVTNEVAIITAYTTFVLKADGKEITGKNCYQDVYIKRRGKWSAISAHVTLLGMK